MTAGTLSRTQSVHLMSAVVRDRLTADLVAKGYMLDFATLLIGELEKFLALCAISDEPLCPTRQVDDAWHAFILRTADYADYCESLGRFIHHHPEDPGEPRSSFDLPSTVAALRAAGLEPDLDIWIGATGAGCESQCDPKCNSAPPPRW